MIGNYGFLQVSLLWMWLPELNAISSNVRVVTSTTTITHHALLHRQTRRGSYKWDDTNAKSRRSGGGGSIGEWCVERVSMRVMIGKMMVRRSNDKHTHFSWNTIVDLPRRG